MPNNAGLVSRNEQTWGKNWVLGLAYSEGADAVSIGAPSIKPMLKPT